MNVSESDRCPSGEESTPRFEDALRELEAIVERLERGQLGLDEALAEYERGVRLIRHCRELLQKAERRIEILSGIDEQQRPITQPFEEEDLSLEEKREKRSRRRGVKNLSDEESESEAG
ncbi:MAG: exodeoxyribonuclease VII small subunit [Thermogutta sp.]|nr:exodeoxyribonuclease VII small subunit [Thermogutta sp.]HOP77950.1 exodeoxyribonuclease VII small subunit [Thermogutta sp.]HPU06457.1 exodeoxyribonuclease VII small subunit [Thermogutta sp.]HPZ83078.1 exodeoxyribonuclease VII small subunit [Thermogutta sp.]HQF15125.1 exodeoxyribonuclease VII small subunit [Thermogutta sp.]